MGLVIVGGSREAFVLAQCHPNAIVRLPVAERLGRDWPGAVQIGPVTADWLRQNRATCLVEAAHPCDAPTACAVRHACLKAGVQMAQLVRPVWRGGSKDRWHRLRHIGAVAGIIPVDARVLVATGRKILQGWRGRRARLIIRHIAPGGARRGGKAEQVLESAGPFRIAQEIRLMRKERIDWLLLQNAGGQGGWAKLAAARQLGLHVAMIDRPRRPEGHTLSTVEEACSWIIRQSA